MESTHYKHWVGILDDKICKPCLRQHGKIYGLYEVPKPKPPAHFFCRCVIQPMRAFRAGTATNKGTDGADFWLKYKGVLPNYYVSRFEAKAKGWNPKLLNFSKACPEQMLAGGIYRNDDGHLPEKTGRIWHEADINYKYGRRNSQRVLYSNDGLIFVTYDHYYTFHEIV